jgi:hypothetical protein
MALMAIDNAPKVEDTAAAAERGEVLPFVYDITAYGADYPVDGIVERMRRGDIEIPEFQRSFVWTKVQSDKFVESLLLGLPVPGIFLAIEDDSRKLLVVDGQQRLTTLRRFYDGRWNKDVYRLEKVQPEFRGKVYDELDEEDRRRLDDSIIHATIVRQDKPSEDNSSIFFVFERLNTGATVLTPQEIRNSIYQGPFTDLLDELASYPAWLRIFGKPSNRLKDRELILRFLALLHESEKYSQPMKQFLNGFMGHHRRLDEGVRTRFSREFTEPTDILAEVLGRQAFRTRTALNAAVFDSVMVGLARRLKRGPISNRSEVALAYRNLLSDAKYEGAIRKATANEENVATRLRLATQAFADIR